MTSPLPDRVPFAGRKEIPLRNHLLSAAALGAAVTAIAAAMAAPASAADSRTVYLRTTVPSVCQSSLWSGSPSLALGEMTDGSGHLVGAFSGTTEFQTDNNYYCNAPSTVILSASPLRVTSAVSIATPDSFSDRVDYSATLTWAGVTGSAVSTAAEPTIISANQPNIGKFNIKVSNPTVSGSKRPVAGTYTGAVTVTVALQP